jgi:hypothetical protein
VGGVWQTDLPSGDLALLQLTADGEPDAAFAGSGLFHPDAPGSTGDMVWMKEVGDGRLWIAGQRYLPGGAVLHHYVGRITSSGEWDGSLGTNEQVTVTMDAPWVADLRDVQQWPDGRFVLAFNAVNSGDGSTALVVLRLLADSAVDTGFGEDGSVVMPCPGQGCGLDAIALQPDNKMVAVGYWVDGSTTRALVQRWLPEAYLVGISEGPEDASAKPYPMPCTTELMVPWSGSGEAVRVEWLDAQGRIAAVGVTRAMGAGAALGLDVPAGLSPGSYALRLSGGAQVRMHRVQVVR